MKITNNVFKLPENYSYRQNNYNKRNLLNVSKKDTVNFSGLGSSIETTEKFVASELPTIDDVIKLFNLKPEKLPSHLKPIVSSNNNKILGFVYPYTNGGELRVVKKLNRDIREGLTYLSFNRKNPNIPDVHINIDLKTHNFLKTSNLGKPIIADDNVLTFSENEVSEKGLNKLLKTFLTLIFKKDKIAVENHQEITKIAQKAKRKEIKVKDFEDKKINEIVAREYWEERLAEKQAERAKLEK
jgi:hypothetical protein